MAIVKTALYSGIWQQFFNLINDNVSDPEARSAKWIYSASPDKIMSTESAYPLIVVNPIEIPKDEPLTFGMVNVAVGIDIDIYSLKAAQIDTLSNSIYNTIDNNRDTLYDLGLKRLDLSGGPNGVQQRGALKVHTKAISWDMTFQH